MKQLRNEVLVFKTTVQSRQDIELLGPALRRIEGIQKWNFDLEDCDKILRVEGPSLLSARICGLLQENGFLCEELQ